MCSRRVAADGARAELNGRKAELECMLVGLAPEHKDDLERDYHEKLGAATAATEELEKRMMEDVADLEQNGDVSKLEVRFVYTIQLSWSDSSKKERRTKGKSGNKKRKEGKQNNY